MKVLEDIWDSIRGNVKSRITDPIIGVFVISWSLFNWDKLAILFFGSGEFETRVNKLSGAMSFTANPDLILKNLELWLLPILLTLFYVFLWPGISGWVALKINPTELERHRRKVLGTQYLIIRQRFMQCSSKCHLRQEPLIKNPDPKHLTV